MNNTATTNRAISAPVKNEKKLDDDINRLVKETNTKLSLSDDAYCSEKAVLGAGGPISYTSEELDAMQIVYDKLTQDEKMASSRIGLRALALTTIVSKLRVDEAVEKYKKFFTALEACDVDSLSFSDTDVDSFLADPTILKQIASYHPCGTDYDGRSVMWIVSSEILVGEERAATQTGILYWLAIHADDKSIRQGITFCIDTSRQKSLSKHGNEKKLQKVNQSYPLRPQSIMIAGASTIMRVSINVLIKIASIFTKQKILDRIEFVTVEQASKSIPKPSIPKYLGGPGGGIDNTAEWVSKRLHSFPIPNIKR